MPIDMFCKPDCELIAASADTTRAQIAPDRLFTWWKILSTLSNLLRLLYACSTLTLAHYRKGIAQPCELGSAPTLLCQGLCELGLVILNNGRVLIDNLARHVGLQLGD